MNNIKTREDNLGRKVMVRASSRMPIIRKPDKMVIWIGTALLFTKRVTAQLGKTLLATILASLADFVRRKSDVETSSMLNKHGGLHNPNTKTENQRNLYGNSNQNGNYGGGYSNDYNNRNHGHESFPGFGR